MSSPTLNDILMQAQSGDNGTVYPFHDTWAQGRTAFGGYTGAVLLAAARRGAEGLPPLRSALVNFTGPVTEAPAVQTEILRKGRNVSTMNARVMVADKVAAQGTFSFGAAQDSHVARDCPAPDASAPDETEHYVPEQAAAMAPKFMRNFDFRLIEGSRPFMGADRGYVRGWIRHKDPASWTTPEGLICVADVIPPAVFPICTKIGPNSSMTWICNFLTDDLETRDGWWMVETNLTAARDGYSSQVMRIWNSAGQLVVEGMQSVIVFV